jgi:hypothetical protein
LGYEPNELPLLYPAICCCFSRVIRATPVTRLARHREFNLSTLSRNMFV